MARRAAAKATAAPTEADAESPIELGVLNDVIGFRLRRIQNHLARAFTNRVSRYDIKPGSFSAVALIAANPGLSQITLSREIGFDKATVVALLDGLEKLKWAERRRAPDDRRRHALFVTPAGLAALAELREQALANEEPIHSALSARELSQLFGLLDKIYATCFADDDC